MMIRSVQELTHLFRFAL